MHDAGHSVKKDYAKKAVRWNRMAAD